MWCVCCNGFCDCMLYCVGGMKTKDEIVALMLSEMPYKVDANVVVYLLEMVQIAQNDGYNSAIYDIMNRNADFNIFTLLKK